MVNAKFKWLRILIFYFIAIIFSYYFRILSPEWYNQLKLAYGLTIIKNWLGALGLFSGAIIITRIFKVDRRNSLFGTDRLKSMLMVIIPVSLFTIIGADNRENVNTHLYGFLLGIVIMIYCILEESGWRGYLQDELRNINPVWQFLIIGFLWYAWHLTFLSASINIMNELVILIILLSASIGIGYAVRHTQSIIVAACLHTIGNIVAFSSLIKQSLSLQNRFIIAGVSILVWIIILIFWDKKALKHFSKGKQ